MIDNKDAEIERLHGRVTENILFIVRRDAIIREKDKRIVELEKEIYRERQMKEIAYVRIAELEAEIDIRDKALDDSQVDWEMWRE